MNRATEQKVYEFDDFRIDVGHRMLYRDGDEIPMFPKAVETLLALIERRGEIVSKDELLEAVWPDAVVEESNLFFYLSLLRKNLGTLKDGTPYVETLRRRGYRFNGDVRLVQKRIEYERDSSAVDFDQREAIPQAGQIYFVKDWDHKTEFEKISSGSSVLPVLKPVESFNEQPVAENELAREHTDAPGLISDIPGRSRSKQGYVLPVSICVVLVAAVIAGSFYWRSRRVVPTSIDRLKTIAILPFRPLVAEDRNESLQLGMADALITRLGSNLIVRPLSSVQRFQNSNQDPISAGRALEVEAVLEGSIQRIGDDIRVNARLLRVADGSTIWGDTFDDKFTNIFLLQTTMATRIAGALTPHLTIAERTQLEKRYTINPEAYEYYLRGRIHSLKVTPEDLQKAIYNYGRAIAEDPNYSLAYAGMAEVKRRFAIAGFSRPVDVYPQAEELAKKALGLDETQADPYISLGVVDYLYKWDWKSAESNLKHAIELEPNNSDAHSGYAHFLSGVGRHEEAIAEGRLASDLSPSTSLKRALESQYLLFAGRQDEAMRTIKTTLEVDPEFWVALNQLARIYIRQQRYEEAIIELEKARKLAPESCEPPMQLGYAFAISGNRERARATLRELESRSKYEFVPFYSFAMIHNGLGEQDKALEMLERAVDNRESQLTFILADSRWDNLRSEPRFQNILKRMNLLIS